MDGSLTAVTVPGPSAAKSSGNWPRSVIECGHWYATPQEATFGPEVEVHTGDLSDAAALAPAFAGVDNALVVVNGA